MPCLRGNKLRQARYGLLTLRIHTAHFNRFKLSATFGKCCDLHIRRCRNNLWVTRGLRH
ncbi:Uncharacterised protein [Vibrio cholerae]|nr:Uncharacterised protein [Vibrio cholerae]CSI75567.1 Uncharacterised protein [Vibrio cholerae]